MSMSPQAEHLRSGGMDIVDEVDKMDHVDKA
jgi:hypothetical protein